MKKLITLTMIFCLIFSCFTVSSSAMAKKTKKYTKVKTATYQKYKKAYNNQKKLNNKIKAQNNKINNLEKQLALKQADYENAMDQYELASEDAEKTHKELDNANSMNRWIWTNLKSMGIKYKGKIWTVPSEYPTTFIVDGTRYQVVIQKVQEGN